MRIRERFDKAMDVFGSVVSAIFLICGALFCLWFLWDYFGLYVPVTEKVSETTVVPEQPKLFGLYDVVRTVDGDTIILNIDGKEKTIRLIGVDAPESVHPDRSRNTEDGKIASDWMSEYLSGKQVYLEYDIETVDDYGRTLAYVYLDDGSTMVQDELLRAGYATVMTIRPNTKYEYHFMQLESAAQANKQGIWNE